MVAKAGLEPKKEDLSYYLNFAPFLIKSRARNFLHEDILKFYQQVKSTIKLLCSKMPYFTGFSAVTQKPCRAGFQDV